RMGQSHAKTNGATVVLHVKREALESESFGEVIHDLGVVIERVRELPRVWPVTVSEARVVGCNQVEAIGETAQERLEHARRRGQAVQQKKSRRIFRASLSVENGESVHLDRAIKSGIPHGMLRSVGLGQQFK